MSKPFWIGFESGARLTGPVALASAAFCAGALSQTLLRCIVEVFVVALVAAMTLFLYRVERHFLAIAAKEQS